MRWEKGRRAQAVRILQRGAADVLLRELFMEQLETRQEDKVQMLRKSCYTAVWIMQRFVSKAWLREFFMEQLEAGQEDEVQKLRKSVQADTANRSAWSY